MKTEKKITFGAMRKLLLDLGFAEKVLPEGQNAFFHQPSDTLLVFRPYRANEPLDWHALASTKRQLDYHGLLSAEAFERRLHEPAA